MAYKFIKNPELIEESYQVEDLLNFSSIINDFKERINKVNKNSIIGLVGPYGSGKSTMLYQIYKDNDKDKSSNGELNQESEKWFVFDAWQYPERKDLWEGFVLDIARQHDKKVFQNTEDKIDGNAGKGKKVLSDTVIDTVSALIPGAGALKNFTHLFKTSPIKRVYDFQDLLLDIINTQIKKDIFIIVEDIDRSGDMGVFFLETLKHFIKSREKDLKHKVIVIVPIGEQIGDAAGDKKVKDSYSKILDFQFTFDPENIKFTNFIKKVFDIEELCSINLNSCGPYILTDHLQYLFKDILLKEQKATIRDIKSILRKSESNLSMMPEENQKQIDIRILILFTAMEYLYQKHKYDSCAFFLEYTKYNSSSLGTEISNTFFGEKLLLGIATNRYITEDLPETVPINRWVYGNEQDEWLLKIERDVIRKYICRINSNYFSMTRVKVSFRQK